MSTYTYLMVTGALQQEVVVNTNGLGAVSVVPHGDWCLDTTPSLKQLNSLSNVYIVYTTLRLFRVWEILCNKQIW